MIDKELDAGHIITLSTDNALGLPLPHPLLFQIHAIVSRIIALKAAAGFPLFPVFDCGDDDDDGMPAFTDNGFVDWLDHHAEPGQHPGLPEHEVLPDRYDTSTTEPHIMRWFKLTPAFPVRHALASSSTSGSSNGAGAQHDLKRDHVEDSDTDTDEERPRKYTVVLSEAGQRMEEKRQLARRRQNEPEHLYWCM